MATMECINTCSLVKQTRPTWERRAETLDRCQLHGQDALKTLSKTNNDNNNNNNNNVSAIGWLLLISAKYNHELIFNYLIKIITPHTLQVNWVQSVRVNIVYKTGFFFVFLNFIILMTILLFSIVKTTCFVYNYNRTRLESYFNNLSCKVKWLLVCYKKVLFKFRSDIDVFQSIKKGVMDSYHI